MRSEANMEQPKEIKTAKEVVKEDEIVIAKLLMNGNRREARDYLIKLGFAKKEIKKIEDEKLAEKMVENK